MTTLEDLGWSEFFAQRFQEAGDTDCRPARVCFEGRDAYRVLDADGERPAELAGRLRHDAAARAELPAVGDWVGVRLSPDGTLALIRFVLPRRSHLSRQAAGRATAEQVLAANMDTLFVVTSLDQDFNLRRIERYLTLAWESGAAPVLLLNKADRCADAQPFTGELESVAVGVPVHVVSAATGSGLEALAPYLARGRTVALVGSSGVGKSTLLNRLLGHEAMPTRAVREDDGRGRHTTSARHLIPLPGGALLLDTPGMRELQLWSGSEGLGRTFGDIESLASDCRFRDCRHHDEPGCAVLAALAAGDLDRERYASYRKLERELAFVERKQDAALAAAHEKKWRTIHKELKQIAKRRRST